MVFCVSTKQFTTTVEVLILDIKQYQQYKPYQAIVTVT